MRARHVFFKEKDYKRIIIISDVHAHLSLLKSLLEEVNVKKDDLLVINGDFINRGESSYETLNYCKQLNQKDNCIILAGNHEYFVYDALRKKKYQKKILNHIHHGKYPTMIKQLYYMLDQSGYKHLDKPKKLTKKILKRYHDAFDFILKLPIILEGQHHIIVHSAYEDYYNLEDDFYKFIKNDAFIEETGYHPKTIIVGHWPVRNIVRETHNNEPYYIEEKNVYAIDGAVGVKMSGELNALIISPTENSYNYSFKQVNHFEPAKVIRNINYPNEALVRVKFPHYDLELVKKGEVLSEFIYHHTGEHLSIFTDLVAQTTNGYVLSWDYVNHFIHLKIGDKVELVNQVGRAAEIKYSGQFYWVDASSIKVQPTPGK